MTHRIPDTERRKIYTVLTHVILIFMLFLLPEMLIGIGSTRVGEPMMRWNAYAKALVYIGVFYADYYIIIDRTLVTSPRKMWKFTWWNIILVAAALLVLWMLWEYFGPRKFMHRMSSSAWRLASFYLRETGMLVLTIALSVAVKLSSVWLTLERQHRDLVSEQRDAELRGLKNQLNPHFLFNTLNTIYALIAVAPDKAQNAVHELSSLLRYVIYETPKTVSLDREVAFIRSYIDLMRLRLGNVPVEASLTAAAPESVQIPPLLFISLIENAFKYGNTGRPGDIIEIKISSDDRYVECFTRNRFDPHRIAGKESSGIGLANLRRRISLIYGDRASLTAAPAKGEGDVFEARLLIPLKI